VQSPIDGVAEATINTRVIVLRIGWPPCDVTDGVLINFIRS